MPWSPEPRWADAGSKPRPSSDTVKLRVPFRCASRTVAAVASEYFATFWRASRQEK